MGRVPFMLRKRTFLELSPFSAAVDIVDRF